MTRSLCRGQEIYGRGQGVGLGGSSVVPVVVLLVGSVDVTRKSRPGGATMFRWRACASAYPFLCPLFCAPFSPPLPSSVSRLRSHGHGRMATVEWRSTRVYENHPASQKQPTFHPPFSVLPFPRARFECRTSGVAPLAFEPCPYPRSSLEVCNRTGMKAR